MCKGKQENRSLLTIAGGHQIPTIDPLLHLCSKENQNDLCYIVPNSLNIYFNVDIFGSFAHY